MPWILVTGFAPGSEGLLGDNTMADEKTPEVPQASQPAAQVAAPATTQVQVDDSQITSCYANFCRVTGTPEELIVDFGLNTQTVGIPEDPVKISQRIILNHFTAKRLLAALSVSVQRHEAAFGVLETDVRKRMQPSAMRANPTAG
jgi:hypothetical protein